MASILLGLDSTEQLDRARSSRRVFEDCDQGFLVSEVCNLENVLLLSNMVLSPRIACIHMVGFETSSTFYASVNCQNLQ